MKIWNDVNQLPTERSPVVASIGNYDGVHLGHQAILNRVVTTARAKDLPSLLITFDPHPTAIVAPHSKPQLLQTRRQKLDCLEQMGLTDVLVLEFTPAVASLNGLRFFDEVLGERLRFHALHVGEDFKFGYRRYGDLTLLKRIGSRMGFDVFVASAVRVDGQTVSSSLIRRAIAEGSVELASRMLGRPFAIEGEVVRGDGRGGKLQFPTANLEVENTLLPKPGVYVTETVAVASRHPSVTNVGFRPTFNGRLLTVESHLLEFEGDLYHERVEVRFLDRIRDEMRFAGPSDLADQVGRDRAAAESFFQNLQFRPG